ncbi:alanine:cation symporter family protein [Brachybacterium sp. EF45031]|nr:alanine:cation symporter family protein [Brachybacterium sillae]
MAAAIFLTVWLRFQPITGLKHSIDVIRGRYTAKTDPGQVSTFQALSTELSGTVGLGNIAGVAVAIGVGGPGAALWIALFGLLAMSVKMAEATLGVMYRTVREDGSTVGGPQLYLRDGLASIGFPKLGRVLAPIYAITAVVGVFGAGNLFQANQVAAIVVDSSGRSFLDGNRWIIGLVMAALAAIVILGGVTQIARWTACITPAMAVLYVACILTILVLNAPAIPGAAAAIVQGAFTGAGVTGGVIGVAVAGIQRAPFSNAAGIGSAGMAHSASKTKSPSTEGFAAMWEPLVDSVIVCTLTALAITVTGVFEGAGADSDGIAMTARAFGTVTGWFPVLLTVAVVLFGFSTVLSYAYYGELNARFLFGDSRGVTLGFRILWVLAVIVGASITLDAVIAFSDAMFFLMSVPNLLGIYFLAKVLRLEILRHRTRVEVGTVEEVPEDLCVGIGSHDPTPQQVEQAERADHEEAERLQELRRTLGADENWSHHDELGRQLDDQGRLVDDQGRLVNEEGSTGSTRTA